MQGYPSIGTTYSLRFNNIDKGLFCAVIKNDFNTGNTTLLIVEVCPEYGKKVTVNSKMLCERQPLGPVFQPAGEVVTENGMEYIRPVRKKAQTKSLKPKVPQM